MAVFSVCGAPVTEYARWWPSSPRQTRGLMALSAGIQYRNVMISIQLQSITQHRALGAERGGVRVAPAARGDLRGADSSGVSPVLLMIPSALGRPREPDPLRSAPRVVTDAWDWFGHEHTGGLRGRRTCRTLVA